MAHRRLRKASSILSILILLFVSISVVSCDIQFTRGTAIQEVFEDQLVNDDVSLHPTESSIVTIRLVPDTSVPETILGYEVVCYRTNSNTPYRTVEVDSSFEFELHDLPRASYRIVGRAITEDGVPVAVGEALIKVSSKGADAAIELKDVGHIMEPHPRVEATCTSSGNIEYWHCTRCGLDFTDERGENYIGDTTIPAKGHSLVHVEAKAPKCTEEGNVEYWLCDRCGKNFEDKEGSVELEDVTVSALGHDWSTEWSRDEHGHWHRCTRCSATDNVAEHDMVETSRVEPTDELEGSVTTSCSVCGHEHTEVLPAIGHNCICKERVLSTCTDHGYEIYGCTHDGCTYTYRKELPLLPHSTSHVVAVEETCTKDGNKEYWYCSICGFYYKNEACSEKFESLEDTIVKASGHRWSTVWSHDDSGHWKVCTVCLATGEKLNHSYNEKNEAKDYLFSDATCESPATYHYSCICGAKGSGTFTVGEPLGHDTHFVKAVDRTCTADGNVAHWHCDKCGRDFEDENGFKQIQNVVLAKFGHNYEIKNNESQHWMQCSRCYDIKDAESHSWVLEVESEEGRTFRCSKCSRTKTERNETDDSTTGFHVDIVSSEPKGRVSYVDNEDGSWTFTFNDENHSSPARIVFWEVDGEEVPDSEGLVVLDLNTPSKRSYRVLCVFTNGNGYGSCEVVVTGGSV